MAPPVPEYRKLMCKAVEAAQWCSTSRGWTPVGLQRLQADFTMTLKEANGAFDAHILDLTKPVKKETGHGEDEYVYSLIAESMEGPVYFHFILDEDPDDPIISIESAHEPSD